MIVTISSCTVLGIQAVPVYIEVDVSRGHPSFNIVGLPDTAIREATQRIRAAIRNCGIRFPYEKRVVINLAPADIRKIGPSFDLAMAVGIINATLTQQLNLVGVFLFGELSLQGAVRPVQQIVSRVLFAQKQQARLIIVPYENLAEAQLVRDAVVVGVQTLHEVLDILQNESIILDQVILTETAEADKVKIVDFADIIGQEKAKRVLEIAIAGRHHVMLSGPPGSGKSLLAQAAASILPTLTYHEQLEVQQIYELTQQHKVLSDRPVRQPHHTISQTAFVGGGVRPQPGEMSLAHHGILFLDEIMEFPRTILETLRQPLEEKAIRIHRNRGSCTFPANFMLIGACNPCPCGYVSDTTHECNCSAAQIHRYQKKLSGPLLERFDMYCEVERIPITQINKKQQQETSKDVQERVQAAQELQKKRYATETITFNGEINAAQIKQYITLKPAAQAFFDEAATRLRLSMRVYHRILKVAQTIADLEQSATIYVQHIAEAFQYREHYLLTNQ